MSKFIYKVRDKFGKLHSGTLALEKGTKDDAARRLREMGYVPVSISEGQEAVRIKGMERFKRVTLQELNNFTRQLYSLQKAGVPLLASLESIAKQTKNTYFRTTIEEVALDIKKGTFFGEAVARQAKVFGDFYISMVKAAETGGALQEILERLCSIIEQEIDAQQRIKAATRYPIIAFFALCIAFTIVITFVIPRFAALYRQFDAPLPLPTQILIGLSLGMRRYWYLILLLLGGAVFAFKYFIKTKSGRQLWDKLKLRIPIFGQLISMFIMSRFARVTAILMKSGVPILEVLGLVSRTSGNSIVSKAILDIRESVNQGKGMVEPMKVTELFTPVVIQMVAIGEETGRVDELLLSVADYYDRELDYTVKNLTTYIEPILIFILSSMVLVMALGIFMPMWNLIRVFQY